MPHWMFSGLKNRFCAKCGEHAQKQDIIGVGIRESGDRSILYIEHKCSKCDYREITTMPKRKGTIEELCYVMLEGINQKKVSERSKLFHDKQKISRSKISKSEVDDLLKFMNASRTHEEFLKYIKADRHIGKKNEHPDKD